jgi:hypothetical protein
MTSTDDKSKRRSSVFNKITSAFKGSQAKTSESTPDAASTAPTTAADVVGKQYDVKGKTALITGAGSGTPSLQCTEKD